MESFWEDFGPRCVLDLHYTTGVGTGSAFCNYCGGVGGVFSLFIACCYILFLHVLGGKRLIYSQLQEHFVLKAVIVALN